MGEVGGRRGGRGWGEVGRGRLGGLVERFVFGRGRGEVGLFCLGRGRGEVALSARVRDGSDAGSVGELSVFGGELLALVIPDVRRRAGRVLPD